MRRLETSLLDHADRGGSKSLTLQKGPWFNLIFQTRKEPSSVDRNYRQAHVLWRGKVGLGEAHWGEGKINPKAPGKRRWPSLGVRKSPLKNNVG